MGLGLIIFTSSVPYYLRLSSTILVWGFFFYMISVKVKGLKLPGLQLYPF